MQSQRTAHWQGAPKGSSALALLLALAAAVLVANVARRDSTGHFLSTQRYEDLYYLPPPAWLDVLALGHREALADLIWMRSLIYFGEELGQRGDVKNLHRYADAMLLLDPYFKRVYSWASTCSLYHGGVVGEKDARTAIGYLERAVRVFPDDGKLAWTLASNYLYELPHYLDSEAAKEEARLRGAENLQVAARLGAGPPWLALSAATTLSKLGKTEQVIANLQEIYPQITDREVKREIEARLSQLRTEAFAEGLRRTVEQLESRRQRDFPYLDQGLHLLVGTRPPFDGRALLLRGFDPAPETFSEPADER